MRELVLDSLYELSQKLGWCFVPMRDEEGVIVGLLMGLEEVVDDILGEDS